MSCANCNIRIRSLWVGWLRYSINTWREASKCFEIPEYAKYPLYPPIAALLKPLPTCERYVSHANGSEMPIIILCNLMQLYGTCNSLKTNVKMHP